MDIKSTQQKCDLKCAFNFNYKGTSIQSLLASNQIYLKFGSPTIKPVKFNDIEYTPFQAILYYPSQTKYNGVQADAEWSIYHNSDVNKRLIVRIPISFSVTSKPASLEQIVLQTASLLPKVSYTNLSIPNFSLEQYVPKGPFYYSETAEGHEIHYGLEDSLTLSAEASSKLTQIMVAYQKPGLSGAMASSKLFFNPDGSNLPSEGGSDFNFLECQEYYEEEMPIQSSNEPNVFGKLTNNPTAITSFWYFIAFLMAAFFLVLFYRGIRHLA